MSHLAEDAAVEASFNNGVWTVSGYHSFSGFECEAPDPVRVRAEMAALRDVKRRLVEAGWVYKKWMAAKPMPESHLWNWKAS